MTRIRYLDDRLILEGGRPAWRGELQERGLMEPVWDPGLRAWWFPDDDAGAAAARFLADAHDAVLDDETEARVAHHLAAAAPEDRLREAMSRLRPYQRDGVAFLVDKRRAFLADGMGLGKTVQALMALEHLNAHPAVVVCPASVKLSWKAEILKWVPWRSVQVLQTGRDIIEDPDIIVVNPELLFSMIEDLILADPRAVVLDEAHYFKNPNAQRSQLAEDLADAVPIRFAMSGTPIPNRRPDIIQQLRLIGQLEEVLHIYRGVLPHWWNPAHGPLRHDHAMRALEQLPRKEVHQRLRKTCFLRRTKEEVTDELPPFHRTRRDLALEERSGYRREEESFVEWVRRLRREHPDGWGAPQRLQGRQHLSRLRREAALAKIPAIVEWSAGLSGERVVYFAHHKQVVRELAAALDAGKPAEAAPVVGPAGGPRATAAGPRATAAGPHNAGGPGDTLARHAIITGDVPAAQRQAIIDGLDQYAGLVATMDASGQGVDGMQVHARHVVFVELDWTPTKHEQCEGRLHRIGQKDRVEAWYFTAQDTIDDAMMRRLDEKWKELRGLLEGEDDIDQFVGEVMDRAARGVAGAGLWH